MQVGTLMSLLAQKDENKVVEQMKRMVPEFVSNVSRYEALDQKMVG